MPEPESAGTKSFVSPRSLPEEGPRQYDGPDSTPDRQGQRFGVFVDDELRSVCTHYEFTASLREQ